MKRQTGAITYRHPSIGILGFGRFGKLMAKYLSPDFAVRVYDPAAVGQAISSVAAEPVVLPNFQNPSGVALSLERRQILVELADRYGVPIIEDDPYGQLRFEGDHLPSVVSLDDRYRNNGGNVYHGNVIYCSTFSKILAPGLRLAWIIAPGEVIRKLVQAKQGADLHTSTFNQFVAHEISRGGFLDTHIKLIRKVYRERRDVMLAAMDRYFPREVDWTQLAGGLFLWGTLPQEMKRSFAQRSDRAEGCLCSRRLFPMRS